jgi:hypothetical protein
MSDDPSKTLPAVDAMRENWEIVDALMGGTRAMRKARTKLLPKFPKEDDETYNRRISSSTLLPAYSETVQNMTGRVFAEPITLGDDVPKPIVEHAENFDRQGNNLQVWAQTFFSCGLSHGLVHALVEYPKTTDAEGNPRIKTKADEKSAGVRPYVVMIYPGQVLGWRSDASSGAHVLTQFRYMEMVEEDDGAFAVKTIPQVRVLEPGKWSTYREVETQDRRKEWQLHEEGTNTLTQIPLTTFYTKRTGCMTATPPLMELGHLNVKHWQSQSDQDNILHVARVPMLAVIGIDDETWNLVVGTSNATKLPKDGDMKWVEHSGAAIQAGRDSLHDLVDDMRLAGAKLIQKENTGVKTATQAEDEAAEELSPLQTMAGQFEDAIDQVLQYFALWTSEPEGGHVKVNGNFDVDFAPEITIPMLVNMATNGQISDETLFGEVQRRGMLKDDLTWKDELVKLKAQPLKPTQAKQIPIQE